MMLTELYVRPEGLKLWERRSLLNSSISSTDATKLNVHVPLRTTGLYLDLRDSLAFRLMLLSEDVLAKDWNTPEEDEAWAHL